MRSPTRSIGDASYRNLLAVSSRPVKLLSILGYNSGPAQFIQVHNTPGLAVAPLHSFPVGAGQFFAFDLGLHGEDMDYCVVTNSTTPTSLTLGAADCGIQAIVAA